MTCNRTHPCPANSLPIPTPGIAITVFRLWAYSGFGQTGLFEQIHKTNLVDLFLQNLLPLSYV